MKSNPPNSTIVYLSGHYRQAMQVLRCRFENIISRAYFHSPLGQLKKDSSATKDEFIQLKKRFNNWKNEGRVNIRASLKILRRINFLNRVEEKEWKELYGNLSRFIYTPEE